MKNLPHYNDSDIGYLDEEFLQMEDLTPIEKHIAEKNLQSEEIESKNEEESKKIS